MGNLSKTMEWVFNEIKKDSADPDPTKLDIEVLKIPYKYGKWINILAMEKSYYLKYKKNMAWLRIKKFDYYRGHPNDEYEDGRISPLKCNTNILANVRVDSDDEVLELEEKMNLQEIKIEQIADFLKAIPNMGWNIKTALEFMKFKQGEF